LSPGAFGATWQKLTGGLAVQRAARRLLTRWQPDLFVALGGPGAAPAVQAAIAIGVPVVLLEYNATPSRLTQKYADRAALVCGGFESLRESLSGIAPLHIAGNPIRAAFLRAFRRRVETFATKRRWDHNTPGARGKLVVLTGTGGDRAALNEDVPKALYKARSELAGWSIIHQSGGRDRRRTQSLYAKLGLRAEVKPYIHDMPRVLATADLAIARPGAITLAELAAAGVPAILVPSGEPGDEHQRANAAVFSTARASRTIGERCDTGRLDGRLAEAVAEIAGNPKIHLEMVASMLRQARPNAAIQLASKMLELVRDTALQSVA
jgi:UDP-N-acetylglucosamine--N-acetylmuramyl-(pentapeptide) pyrophosphoryl-undecaprenol N-acetylglucosamine transferase